MISVAGTFTPSHDLGATVEIALADAQLPDDPGVAFQEITAAIAAVVEAVARHYAKPGASVTATPRWGQQTVSTSDDLRITVTNDPDPT